MKRILPFACAVLCAGGLLSAFNPSNVSAQIVRPASSKPASPSAPAVSATLSDTFPDPDGDGRAAAGAVVTYTATVTNNGTTDATGIVYNNTIDGQTTLVAGSVQVQPDMSVYTIRCTFNTASGGSGNCTRPSSAYGVTDASNTTILGGQGSRLNLTAANASYNSGTKVFSFDATLQNLLNQSIGTIDNVTPEAAGSRLFLSSAAVTAGSGVVSFVNADGTGTFNGPNQPYFQFNGILAQNQTTAAKTLQLNVPNTVNTFTLDFLVSTKAAARLVINEVLSNPGGTILDANGEWFEVYNNGLFPVNMYGFYVGDSSAAGDRPIHFVAAANQNLTVQPGGYRVFGNTTNTTNNGGVTVDYAYGAALQLANSLDAVRVLSPYSIPTDTANGQPGYFIELDRVVYNSAAISAQNGISRELKNPDLDNANMDGSNWADASVNAVYGPGGRGTPGAQNSAFSVPTTFAGSRVDAVRITAPGVIAAGETVSANLGTIAPGGSAVVTYQVTVPNPIPTGTTQISTQGTISGGNFANVTTDDPASAGANDATVTPIGLAPTAAQASIAGRVLAGGKGLSNVRSELTGTGGRPMVVTTNAFGYFVFGEVEAGATYVINVSAKKYTFAPQVFSVTDNVSGLVFVGQ